MAKLISISYFVVVLGLIIQLVLTLRKKCDPNYNWDNYYAEFPLNTHLADSVLGTSKLYEQNEKIANGDGCPAYKNVRKIPQNYYLDSKLCEPVLQSKLPLPPIQFDAECQRCSIIHPTSAKNLMLHCVGCIKTKGLQNLINI
ncbi:uncharacterized protein LOC123301406 [Chrysoperla carnea]|uniref:uncharacterized protein LOC123301406 n=1 Tax=Chrysoperla carnea TaxID=189513 RepID=UPI001D07B09C|nr:uncharacterized protein LOC123301406 [Chrysoperla carnea]